MAKWKKGEEKKKNNGYNLGFYNGYFDGRGLFVGNIFKYKAFLSPEALKQMYKSSPRP